MMPPMAISEPKKELTAEIESHAAASLLRHRVAVEGGHNSGGIAGNVQQNRRDSPAVFAADVNGRQQDQRGLCGKVQRKSQRQQDRHAVNGA